jgi:hypothetical protein
MGASSYRVELAAAHVWGHTDRYYGTGTCAPSVLRCGRLYRVWEAVEQAHCCCVLDCPLDPTQRRRRVDSGPYMCMKWRPWKGCARPGWSGRSANICGEYTRMSQERLVAGGAVCICRLGRCSRHSGQRRLQAVARSRRSQVHIRSLCPRKLDPQTTCRRKLPIQQTPPGLGCVCSLTSTWCLGEVDCAYPFPHHLIVSRYGRC